ncbi:cytosolic non-specific dipeptidase-like [Scaptodrosophila lebanonensis]|uniref:Cytosolic non-specific dipeptidase-like n=1 Tax=Drosophila lebanonensis TaxID=7225 RepID=A0A6J2TYA4_DROLE|nr:cytosolic non-specific dipeptidase-like [Scaptodrosophila lebanonensis]
MEEVLSILSRRDTLLSKIDIRANSPLKRLFQTVHLKRECYINDLWEIVGYETISTREDRREELQRCVNWLLKRLMGLDVVAFGEPMGLQLMNESFKTIQMPSMIIGVIAKNPGRPTILVYGNVDVEDASMEEGWTTDPFVLTEIDEFLYGRGVALDKGPLLCWLNAIQSYRDAGMRLPVNLVFLIESMAHSNSLGLETVLRQRIGFFREVSCVAICTRRWISNKRPGIIYGSRGLVYYHLEVECANRDLSSCEHGGTLYEALPDLFYLLSTLVDGATTILVEGLTSNYEVDMNVLQCADFNYRQFGRNVDSYLLPHKDSKVNALHSLWAMPHLSIHGIEGANASPDLRFVIPHRVVGKFSVSMAPNQKAALVTEALQKHLGLAWVERGSPNKMSLCEKFVIPSWTGAVDTPEYAAAVRAMHQTYDAMPNYIRDGGSILAPTIFREVLNKNVIVLPIASNDNGGGPINERLSVENYVKGSQMLSAFMWEYGEVGEDTDSEIKVNAICKPKSAK